MRDPEAGEWGLPLNASPGLPRGILARGGGGSVPSKRCATLCGGDNRLTCAGRARTAGVAFTGGMLPRDALDEGVEGARGADDAREAGTMSMVERGALRCVNTDELSWRPSAFARGVLVKDIAVTDGWEMQIVRFEPGARFPIHTHERPEFVFILEGELIQGRQRRQRRRGRALGHRLRVRAGRPRVRGSRRPSPTDAASVRECRTEEGGWP
jgi:ChrR Cupin-like domain